MARLNKKRTVRFSCGVCGQNCGTDYLKCTMCGNRYHTECQAMCADDSDLWKELGLDYVCVTCRTMDGVEFDYLIGMHRLKRVSRGLTHIFISFTVLKTSLLNAP